MLHELFDRLFYIYNFYNTLKMVLLTVLNTQQICTNIYDAF
jgi:hypothetical protein